MGEVINKANAILMENHGAIVLSYKGIERALDLLEMLEAMAASVLVTKQLGNIEYISKNEIENLDNVCRTRNMPFQGNPKEFKSLVEAYK